MAVQTPIDTIHATHIPAASSSTTEAVRRRLPSGRTLVIRAGARGEEVEIRDAGGQLDIAITLTDAGPVVRLQGARIEVESPDVAVRCRTFDVQATERIKLASEGEAQITADEVRVRTEHDIHLNGAFLRLNCTEDAAPVGVVSTEALEALNAAQPAANGDHGDHHH